jgi:hypothetical protein
VWQKARVEPKAKHGLIGAMEWLEGMLEAG